MLEKVPAVILSAIVVIGSVTSCRGESESNSDSVPRTVILISVDTLRSDRLPIYGYDRIAAPAIDALASDSIVFDNVWSHAPLTLPAHLSMLTGELPPRHGVRNNIGFSLRSNRETIVESLAAGGYQTAAFVSSWVLRSGSGIERGFSHYDDDLPWRPGVSASDLERSGVETISRAVSWLEGAKGEKVFVFLHLYEPHAPWSAPEPFATRHSGRPYDAEVEYAAFLIGEFLESLRALDRYEDALIILTSDHGEGLGDHGETEHGVFVYREALQVPLVLKLPGGSGGGSRRDQLTGLVDLAPTIAAQLGIDPVGETGVSLLAAENDSRLIYAESWYPRFHLGWSELHAVISDRWHLIEGPGVELYDYLEDPQEKENQAAEQRRQLAELLRSLRDTAATPEPSGHVTSEERQKLAALGYVGRVRESSGPLPDPRTRIGDLEGLRAIGSLAASGRHEEAIGEIEPLLASSPGFTEGWILYGRLLETTHRFDEAVEAWRTALRGAPELRGELGLSAASALLAAGRPDEAVDHAELSREANPSAAALLVGRARLSRKDFRGALEEAERARMDESGRAALLAAEVHLATERLEAAARELASVPDPAVRRQIENFHTVLGELHGRRKEWAEAEEALLNEIDAYPHNLRAWTTLALVRAFSAGPAEVDETLEQMYLENPWPAAAEAAAETLGMLGDREGAERWRS